VSWTREPSNLDFLLGFGLSFLTVPLLVLVHELGHAIAALHLTRGPVRVYVGRDPKLVGRVGRLELYFGFRPPKGGPTGVCLHARARTPLREMAIALAGPLASALSVIVVLLAYLVTLSAAPPFVPIACLGTLFWAGLMVVLNLGEMEGKRAPKGRRLLALDGEHAKRAWRAHRAGVRHLPAAPAREPERPGSVPPPGRG
jgi:membrane-associated protease RseP (regulator of RpoE activity)